MGSQSFTSPDDVAAVKGENTGGGFGVSGVSNTNHAVHGESAAGRGVVGVSQTFVGVSGFSTSLDGVFGQSDTGVGVHGKGGKLAGLFDGDIQVNGKFQGDVIATGKVQCDSVVTGKIDCPNGTVRCFDVSISNADCAEEFELAGAETVEPGTLMSFSGDGTLYPSLEAYDSKVVGVISGAGEYKPGIVLDKRQGGNRVPIALMGKVYCKVDAEYSAIEVGDLLTTSPTAGHAMKASDPSKAFGSVIGKALRPKNAGRGMIPVLVTLQ